MQTLQLQNLLWKPEMTSLVASQNHSVFSASSDYIRNPGETG